MQIVSKRVPHPVLTMHLIYWRWITISVSILNIIISSLRLVFWGDIITFPMTLGSSLWVFILLMPIKLQRQDQTLFSIPSSVKYVPWVWLFMHGLSIAYIIVLFAFNGVAIELVIWLLYTIVMMLFTMIIKTTFDRLLKLRNSLHMMQRTCKTSSITFVQQ